MFRKESFGGLIAAFHGDNGLFLLGLIQRGGQNVAAADVEQPLFGQQVPFKPAFYDAYNIIFITLICKYSTGKTVTENKLIIERSRKDE